LNELDDEFMTLGGCGPLSGRIRAMPRSTWTPCRDSVRIAPSLLAADFGHIAEAARDLEHSGAERIHVDVMDGVFVPNFTFGTDTVRVLRRETSLPLELHLMIVNPDRHLDTFASAGADAITVHYEASPHLHRTLTAIRALDCRAGAAINPSTPAAMLEDILEACDLALVMTIDPGFGGQALIPRTLHKVEQLRAEIERQGLMTEVEVDGGVDVSNARACVDAGADVLVAGTAVFGHANGPHAGVAALVAAVSGAAA
jgi:ribulose-phosphate 3-epimerase